MSQCNRCNKEFEDKDLVIDTHIYLNNPNGDKAYCIKCAVKVKQGDLAQ